MAVNMNEMFASSAREAKRFMFTIILEFLKRLNDRNALENQFMNLNYFRKLVNESINAFENGENPPTNAKVRFIPNDISYISEKALQEKNIPYMTCSTDVFAFDKNNNPIYNSDGRQQVDFKKYIMYPAEYEKEVDKLLSEGNKTIQNARSTCEVKVEDLCNINRFDKMVVYNNLTANQVETFRDFARENGFQFARKEHDNGRNSIIVKENVAKRLNLNKFVSECNLFNACGLYNKLEYLNDIDKFNNLNSLVQECNSNNFLKPTYLVNLQCPAEYVEIKNGTMSIHSQNGSVKNLSSANTNLREELYKYITNARYDKQDIIKVNEKEFESIKNPNFYEQTRAKFSLNRITLNNIEKHSILIQDILKNIENHPNFNPEKAMLNEFSKRPQKILFDSPENQITAQKEMDTFIEKYKKADNTEKENLLKTSAPSIISNIEVKMMLKSLQKNLTPTEFVYGTIMATAEKLAKQNKDTLALDSIERNAFNTNKIETMLKTQDVIHSGLATIDNPSLTENLNNYFTNAVMSVTNAELHNNRNFLTEVKDVAKTAQAFLITQNIIEEANQSPDVEFKKLFNSQEAINDFANQIKSVLNGEKTFNDISTFLQNQLPYSYIDEHISDIKNIMTSTRNLSINELNNKNFLELSGSSMFSEYISFATVKDFIETENVPLQYQVLSAKEMLNQSEAGLDIDNITITDINPIQHNPQIPEQTGPSVDDSVNL